MAAKLGYNIKYLISMNKTTMSDKDKNVGTGFNKFVPGLVIGLVIGSFGTYGIQNADRLTGTNSRASLNKDNVLILVNQERISKGLETLKETGELDGSAFENAEKISSSGNCTHDFLRERRDGGEVLAKTVSEVVNCGETNAEKAVGNFFESPTHQKILLDPEKTSLGIGISGDDLVIHLK